MLQLQNSTTSLCDATWMVEWVAEGRLMQTDLVRYLLPTLSMTPRWNSKQKRTNILHGTKLCATCLA